ncbi:uncharacterized protein EI90DRAFT_3068497 [Cantharellus anzutake]|uniref:uncharacterized protein n=1 Tax=Cantharellus anzutake TaxID=1750568 RepID=UPI001907199D|nr:uncharacterized protein EI90DRAFT_3068497 [Cantharellus anzutake]KAF8327270.1 hypothetical protein EI90DRAFT_3068497 [Cantharellus anzutake]
MILDLSVSRERQSSPSGRELSPVSHSGSVTHIGRGGRGNVHSPSPADEAINRQIVEDAALAHEHDVAREGVQFTGRGGYGNRRTISPAPELPLTDKVRGRPQVIRFLGSVSENVAH